jgi:hypothetical protein
LVAKTAFANTRLLKAVTARNAMIRRILIVAASVLGLLIVGFVLLVAMQPSTYHVERSTTMPATAEDVFGQVNDFHNWDRWSPWLKEDPNAKVTYEGPPSGEGAVFRWAGNENVGEGNMKIIESKANERVRIELNFLKPMEGTAQTEFTLVPAGEQTKVTWSMDGNNNFLGKMFCLFMDMDEMIGSKYEEGLANMKKIVESPESKPGEPPPLVSESSSKS